MPNWRVGLFFKLALVIIVVIDCERSCKEESNGVLGVKEILPLTDIFPAALQHCFFKMAELDHFGVIESRFHISASRDVLREEGQHGAAQKMCTTVLLQQKNGDRHVLSLTKPIKSAL